MSHDYHPSWDYNLVEPGNALVRVTRACLQDIESLVELIAEDISDFSIKTYFVDLESSEAGRFAAGTSSQPVIMLDPQNLLHWQEITGAPLYEIVSDTIVHELGHALQEARGDEDLDEDEAESFAQQYKRGSDVSWLWREGPIGEIPE